MVRAGGAVERLADLAYVMDGGLFSPFANGKYGLIGVTGN
jgi:hypothetical protein